MIYLKKIEGCAYAQPSFFVLNKSYYQAVPDLLTVNIIFCYLIRFILNRKIKKMHLKNASFCC